MTQHVMVDIETMGVGSDAAIIAIGAVAFDPATSGRLDRISGCDYLPVFDGEFYVTVDLQSSLDNGLTVQASTIKWWLEQSDAARAEFTSRSNKSLHYALALFTEFLNKHLYDDKGFLWARGTDFDISILKTAYRKADDVSPPWGYNRVRDSRTLFMLFPECDPENLGRIGVGHNALDDAKNEALGVIKALRKFEDISKRVSTQRTDTGYDPVPPRGFGIPVMKGMIGSGIGGTHDPIPPAPAPIPTRVPPGPVVTKVTRISGNDENAVVHNVGEMGACDCSSCMDDALYGVSKKDYDATLLATKGQREDPSDAIMHSLMSSAGRAILEKEEEIPF